MNTVALDDLVCDGSPICYGILMPGEDTEGGIPVVKVRDYDHKGIGLHSLLRTSPEIEAPFRRSRLEPGDILISIRGTTGVLAVVPSELKGANITQDSARIRVDGAEVSYVYQALHASSVQRQIRLHTIGQAVRGINIAAVRRLQLPWPEKGRRITIATILSLMDEVIRLIDRLYHCRLELKRCLAQQLFSGQKRFPEFVRSAARQRGEFGTIPEEWRLIQIAAIATECSERGSSGDDAVYSCTKHDGLVPSLEYFGKQVFSRNLRAYKRMSIGDFAYATNHIEEGSIGLLRKGQQAGLVSPMYTVFRCGEEVNPDFLYAVLKTENYRRIFERRTSASVARRGSLRWKEFAKIRVPLPSLDEQDRIVTTLTDLDSEIGLLRAQREQHKLYKKGLLNRLLFDEKFVSA